MTCFIGIAGTHSTGKSTFVASLKEKAESMGITVKSVADKATDCRSVGFGILRAHTFESTLWIMSSVIRGELEAGLNTDLVIVDRPVPDALGYLEAALEMTGRTITEIERNYLYRLAEMHVPRYSLLLNTKLDQSIPLGEGRDQDAEFRVGAGRWIAKVLATLNCTPSDPHDATTAGAVDSILAKILESKGR